MSIDGQNDDVTGMKNRENKTKETQQGKKEIKTTTSKTLQKGGETK